MPRRRLNRRPASRGLGREPAFGVESLEHRIELTAGIAHDRAARVLSIVGSAGNDVLDGGTGRASPESFLAALRLAGRLAVRA